MILINGEEIKIKRNIDFELLDEYKNLEVSRKIEGSLTFNFKPNPLYEFQQKTGKPRLCKVMPF